jgi:hydrogenase expression/formation protein HypE
MNELAGFSKLGMKLIQKDIPVDEQVDGACEMLGLDPLYVANEGLFMAIVDAAIADSVLGLMQQDEKGIDAAIIGEVTTDHSGQVVMTSRIGGRRVVNYLAGEQLPRIC